MTAPKIGDRVEIHTAGLCLDSRNAAGRVRVRLDGNGDTAWIGAHLCTVIAPPVQVGDVVTADNYDQLGPNTVIAAENEPAFEARYTDNGLRWFGTDGSVRDSKRFSNAKVLRVGAKP